MGNLFLLELRSRRNAILGWGLGIALFGVLIIMLFPEFAAQLGAFNLEEIEIYQILGDFGDFATFKGFIRKLLFNLSVPQIGYSLSFYD